MSILYIQMNAYILLSHSSSKALEICSSFEPARISLAYLLQAQGHFMEAWNKLSEGHEDEDRVRRGQEEEDRGRSEGREGSKLQEKSKTALSELVEYRECNTSI